MKKLKRYFAVGTLAVLCMELLSVKLNAQTNSTWGRMMWSNYGPDSVRASWAVTNSSDGSLKDADGNYLIPPQYITLHAKVRSEISTNWTTIGTILPNVSAPTNPDGTPSMVNDLVYHATGYIQSGTITSNTIAEIEWHGKWVPVVVESQNIGNESRTIWK